MVETVFDAIKSIVFDVGDITEFSTEFTPHPKDRIGPVQCGNKKALVIGHGPLPSTIRLRCTKCNYSTDKQWGLLRH
jgi:hypothetical protein